MPVIGKSPVWSLINLFTNAPNGVSAFIDASGIVSSRRGPRPTIFRNVDFAVVILEYERITNVEVVCSLEIIYSFLLALGGHPACTQTMPLLYGPLAIQQ